MKISVIEIEAEAEDLRNSSTYIKCEAVVDIIESVVRYCGGDENMKEQIANNFIRWMGFPRIDIVHCKYCHHFEPYDEDCERAGMGDCNYFDAEDMNGDDYCSYGKRKDEKSKE